MNRFFTIICALLMTFAGCKGGVEPEPGPEPEKPTPEQEEPETEPSIKLVNADDASISFEEAGGEATVAFASALEWTVSTTDTQDWCTVTPLSGHDGDMAITITVPANEVEEARSTSFDIVSKNSKNTVTTTISVSQAAKTHVDPPKKNRILAIGNSFSVDAMQYLYDVLKAGDGEDIHLGNLYIGGCSLQTHATNLANGTAAYTYYQNTTGTWKESKSDIVSALKSEEWDYVTVQQVSGYSGIPDSYEPYLSEILKAIKENCPGATIAWHMTWAYQRGSTHSDFPKYESNQQKMYDAIVNTVKSNVLTKDDISLVIPSGTAIQNARTSIFGDNLTRDGYHMSYNVGRVITAYMWAKMLGNCDFEKIDWVPSNYTYTAEQKAVIKESVLNAFDKPYEVTPSSIEHKIDYTPNKELKAVIEAAGYKSENYDELAYEVTFRAYYNSMANSTLQCAANGSTATNLNQFAATKIFSKGDLPNGTLLVLKDGYQYRPEGWTALTAKNNSTTRPGNVTTQIVKVDKDWWGSWNFRAFNLAVKGNPAMTDEQMENIVSAFAIFVPKDGYVDEGPTCDELLEKNGYKLADYTKASLEITLKAYYNSGGDSMSSLICAANGSTAANLVQFAATKIFSKEEIPAGSIIVVRNGYQYRPEGWTALNVKNSTRPGNVTTTIVKVDDAWWGSWNFRAFNLAQEGNPDLSDKQQERLKDCFAIYLKK